MRNNNRKTPRSRPDLSDNLKDPVKVFCRICPLQSDADLSCVKVRGTTTVILTPPEAAVNYKFNQKETQYIFKHVFDASATQRELYTAVAQPLVENLIRGKNGLLFTYGVTGSGKTYTMTGDHRDRGIMPRCMDALFKTISDYQAKRFIFKPDRLNGFEILSEADAMLERQLDMNTRFNRPTRKDSDPEIASQASCDANSLDGIDEDNMYSVFVTYVEVYNNSVYDLLERGDIQKTLQSKIIREDATHNMFVHGVRELEIKTVEEAIEAFQIGQKRKRMGHTILNAESSRSHAVFTVRLVQAPTDSHGENVIQDKNVITISQLSLVDLAGSERTNRTKNTGQRLREAGNINNSLMTLRTCLEYLRENQLSGSSKKIPYRDSKVTHLFKNYFDGEGQVSMIVCINPRAEDYDETSQVMKFAEMTQEVQIPRPTPIKHDIGLTPGRRKANKLISAAIDNFNELRKEIDLGLVYSLGPNYPEFKMDNPDSEVILTTLQEFLLQRMEKRRILNADLDLRMENFRMHLLNMEKENIALKTESSSTNATLQQDRQKILALENRIVMYENSIDELNRKLRNGEERIKYLQKQLNEKQVLLSLREDEKEKQKKKFTSKMAVETDKMNRELEQKLRRQRTKLQEEMRVKDEKLRMVSNILKSDNVGNLPHEIRSLSSENLTVQPASHIEVSTVPQTMFHTPRPPKERAGGVPVANIRHRRSRSAGDKWLEHRAANTVPVGTILQPYFKNRKSVTKLTDARDLTSKTSKYCLLSQTADTDGELETKIFKGDVIPTSGGGAQVVFNDVECLKQKSPVPSPNRKRPSNSRMGAEFVSEDVASRCTIGIEGHSSTKKPRT